MNPVKSAGAEPRQQCPHAVSCPLYAIFTVEALLQIWKVSYCEGKRFGECERFKRSHSLKPIPINLLPNGQFITTGGR